MSTIYLGTTVAFIVVVANEHQTVAFILILFCSNLVVTWLGTRNWATWSGM